MARAVSGDHNRFKLAIDVCPIPFNNQGKTTVMTHNHSSKPSFARLRSPKFLRKSAAFLGLGFWASSLAVVSPTAQSQSNATPYCFGVKMDTFVYASPSFRARQLAPYAIDDIAYATTNQPTSVPVNDGTADGNSFIEVAFTNGDKGWTPRYPEGIDVPILIDMEGFTDCPNPGKNAAGDLSKSEGNDMPTPQNQPDETPYCFGVKMDTFVYASPSFRARQLAPYAIDDIAYATTNQPTSVPVNDGTADGNSFIEVAFTNGDKGWTPRYPEGIDVPILIDMEGFTDCPNPGKNAAGDLSKSEGNDMPTPQNQPDETPYCFGVKMDTFVYASPSFRARQLAPYAIDDIAYATTNQPTSVPVNDGTADGNSFIEVAFTNGDKGWTPRYPEGIDVPILIDMEGFTDCPNPGLNAAGGM
jgi:cytochrome c5